MVRWTIPVVATLALATGAFASGAIARAASGLEPAEGRPQGQLGLSFAPDRWQVDLDVEPGEVFGFYLLAELDAGAAPRHMGGYEGCIELPPTVSLEAMILGDASALVRHSPDGRILDYSAVFATCKELRPGTTVLARFTAVANDVDRIGSIHLAPSSFSSTPRGGPAWSPACALAEYPPSLPGLAMVETTPGNHDLRLWVRPRIQTAMDGSRIR